MVYNQRKWLRRRAQSSIESQNQEIRELQRRLATYQIHPAVCTAIMMHQGHYGIGKYGYDKSLLEMEVEFFNQIAESRMYQLNYYIHAEKNAKKLLLNNLHTIILEGRNDSTNREN